MDINKFTQKSREAVQDAQALTIEYGNMQIEQAHSLSPLFTFWSQNSWTAFKNS